MAVMYDMSRIDAMEGHEFEHFIANLLCKLGYQKVEVTPGSGDQGVDVLAEKDDIRYALQCKCYSSDLGNTPVQEITTGKIIYHCHVGVVVTNRYFTQGAKEAANATGVLLWDRSKLQDLINQVELMEPEVNFDKKGTILSKQCQRLIPSTRHMISIGFYGDDAHYTQVAGINSDGAVLVAGDTDDIQSQVRNWEDIVRIYFHYDFIVGLSSDRKVMLAGMPLRSPDVANWTDIIEIATGEFPVELVGLKSDGTVVAAASLDYQEYVKTWKDIVAIASSTVHIVGLKSDRTVVAIGDNSYGECDVQNWQDIVAISASRSLTLGLKSDGTVVIAGEQGYGLCDVQKWRNIVAIAAGNVCAVGLTLDGRVVVAGAASEYRNVIYNWTDVIAIAAGYDIMALKSDGTVLTTSKCDVKGWKLFDDINIVEQRLAERNALAERRKEEEAAAERRRQEEYERQEEEKKLLFQRLEEERCRREHEDKIIRQEKIVALERKRTSLQVELANLKGIFTGRQRREIETQLIQVDAELKELYGGK